MRGLLGDENPKNESMASLIRSRPKRQRLIFHSLAVTFIALILFSLAMGCDEQSQRVDRQVDYNSKASFDASEALLDWLSESVELMVQHKASCAEMARHLATARSATAKKRAEWRTLGAGEVLARRAIQDPTFGRQLNQLILKGDLVYSYCAYQSSFRDKMRVLITNE